MPLNEAFIQSLDKFVLDVYCVPARLDPGHTAVNKITSLTLWSPHSNGENDSSQINQNGYNEKDKRNIILKKARAK